MDAHLDTTHVRKVKRYGSATIDEFLDNVDDLTKAIKDIEAPEIARVRAKVKMALAAAKSGPSFSAEAGFTYPATMPAPSNSSFSHCA